MEKGLTGTREGFLSASQAGSRQKERKKQGRDGGREARKAGEGREEKGSGKGALGHRLRVQSPVRNADSRVLPDARVRHWGGPPRACPPATGLTREDRSSELGG